MPLYDYYCESCGATKDDVLCQPEDIIKCDVCEAEMRKRPNGFSFRMTPGSISKFKKKFGKNVPPDYKTRGGCNIYGKPRGS